jgi:hypothetical protein
MDLNTVGRWLWGGMALAYLYHYLDDFVRPCNKTMTGCVTLMMVINLILFVYVIYDLIRLIFICSSI